MPQTIRPAHAVTMTCTLAAGADAAEAVERLGGGLASADPGGVLGCWAVQTADRTLELVAVFADTERAAEGRTALEHVLDRIEDRLTVREFRVGPAADLLQVARGDRAVRLSPREVPGADELGRR